MTTIASFSPTSGILSIFGDAEDSALTISRNAAGTILVNGGAIVIQGGSATVANTTLIQAFGQGGNDTITLDESNGALPRANLFGGTGNDLLTSGSGADMLFGQAGNDTLFGKGGADFLFGGTENDVLTGGDADDQVFGEAGDDRMIWNPGDDSDLFEGGAGIDTAEINGGNGAEAFTLTANGERVRFDRVNPAPFALDIGTTEKIVVNMNGGNDTFSATGNLASLIGVTVDGGMGDDTILGSNGADVLLGGDGNDFLDGQQGNDVAFLGSGDDVFQWDPGDGSDVVEGQSGIDTLAFNGSNIGEKINLSANGGRASFFRDVANINMDLNDVETIDFRALGGADAVTVNDLSGTDVAKVLVDLAGGIGGTSGDGQADTVTVNGTGGNDTLGVLEFSDSSRVTGLSAVIHVEELEAADTIVLNLGSGNDSVDIGLFGGRAGKLVIDAGVGDDTVFSGSGPELILGSAGSDTVSYRNSFEGVTVDLSVGTASGGNALGDVLAEIENLSGSRQGDTLTGSGLANRLDGGAGGDAINGGLGSDVSQGRAGQDSFLFNTNLNASTNVDHITDFKAVDDTIRLDDAIFGALNPGALPSSAFKDTASGSVDANDRIIYNSDTGNLSYDTNGSTAGGRTLFAVLDNDVALSSADFLVV